MLRKFQLTENMFPHHALYLDNEDYLVSHGDKWSLDNHMVSKVSIHKPIVEW